MENRLIKNKDLFRFIPHGVLYFLILIGATILFTYKSPVIIRGLWYLALLVLYYKSDDEPFWMALFLILSDGFAGFFGAYEVNLGLLPGMPGIELGQFYILLTIIKSSYLKRIYPVFFQKQLEWLFIYLIFTVAWGFMLKMPSELNEILRVAKLVFPFMLFYSVSRLFGKDADYERFFSFVFLVTIVALVTHIFTIISGMSPAEYIGFKEMGRYTQEYSEGGQTLRVFYNTRCALLSLFAGLYYMTRGGISLHKAYLSFIVASVYLMAFLSATRGWIIAFTLVLLLYMVFVLKLKPFTIIGIGGGIVLLFMLAIRNPVMKDQFEGSWDRVETLSELEDRDITLGSTQVRTTVRSAKVLLLWKQNPLFGWGYSKTFLSNSDGHVGNQNILLHSGVMGAALMLVFFSYFNYKLLFASKTMGRNPGGRSLLVFPVFFLGWFIIHSTSGQQFAYSTLPGGAITIVMFFTFGAFAISNLNKKPALNKSDTSGTF